MSFAQIKLSLDTAPRLVLQFAAAKEVVDSRPLGGDQQAFNFVVKLAMFCNGSIAGTSVDEVCQPVPVLSADYVNHVW